jgi:Glyoxalase/Bleomycin resistance protein/Dioxygenase superfamily
MPATVPDPEVPGAGEAWLEEPPCHLGIIVENLSDAMARYSATLGVSWAQPQHHTTVFRFPSSGDRTVSLDVVWSLQGPVHYELIEARSNTIWSLENSGPLHHVGYWTSNLLDGVERLQKRGSTVEVTLPGDAPVSGFAYLRLQDGMRVEAMDLRSKAAYDEYLSGGRPL